MKMADKHGNWYTNFSQFRMHDPMSDTYFEPGEPTKATPTKWLEKQHAVIKPTTDDGVPIEDAETAAEPAKAKK